MSTTLTEKPKTGKQSELLHTQQNAEEQENNSNLCEIKKMEGTPFTIVRKNDEGEFNSFIAIGNNRLTGMMTDEECERMIEEKDWNLLVQMTVYVASKLQEENHKQIQKEAGDEAAKKLTELYNKLNQTNK